MKKWLLFEILDDTYFEYKLYRCEPVRADVCLSVHNHLLTMSRQLQKTITNGTTRIQWESWLTTYEKLLEKSTKYGILTSIIPYNRNSYYVEIVKVGTL